MATMTSRHISPSALWLGLGFGLGFGVWVWGWGLGLSLGTACQPAYSAPSPHMPITHTRTSAPSPHMPITHTRTSAPSPHMLITHTRTYAPSPHMLITHTRAYAPFDPMRGLGIRVRVTCAYRRTFWPQAMARVGVRGQGQGLGFGVRIWCDRTCSSHQVRKMVFEQPDPFPCCCCRYIWRMTARLTSRHPIKVGAGGSYTHAHIMGTLVSGWVTMQDAAC